ncbi:PilZ domain protein [Pseudomonas syringae pv. helianthi]|uniref:PilZ domain protein n=3 Tax=Pseudomonas syringae group genomosp. 7 TaxID=251699 RepID=A0A0P9RQQ9_9PSED|nr:PilZ domain protein [Pseudomonas syringae pv. helianthi]KPY88813.1 PilZ domain protein [Pseudomonas syringae pv. tagetis]RMV47798.1 PilZ domain protein [Pseudomonas syringae pv. helianthi]RMW19388.1 PilZ domain protein [Pseudomonas syringae pv. tagetis]RMW19665.1 PilZ domain protein [Pseudomonas syringae pv. tagetis]
MDNRIDQITTCPLTSGAVNKRVHSMTDSHADRRRFKRIAFDAKTDLNQGSQTWKVQLIDLSLKGLLIERPESWTGDQARPFEVDIRLSNDAHVKMDVEMTHDNNRQLGFVCRHIGLESISHLRRLIELNLADQAELDRELAALIEL